MSVQLPCEILYEDNHILVVVKPPNLPVQADSSGDTDLLTLLKQYIKETYHKPGDVYLGLCHRLDRPVGGVMIFARTSKAAARLSAQFQSRDVRKHYVAVVDGALPNVEEYSDYLLCRDSMPKVQVFSSLEEIAKEADRRDAKPAKLRCHRIGCGEGQALLDIELFTGRKHQIRAQLAAHGCPIVCDQRYHPRAAKGQIALWAYALSFLHPTRKERLEFFSIPPLSGAFAPYAAQLSGLPVHAACYVIAADKHVLAVAKRAGIEVTRADAGEDSLQARLEPYFGPLFPVHRLDANTEGVLLFARSEAAGAALTAALRAEGTEKHYACVVCGRMPCKEDTLRAWAEKAADGPYARRLTVFDEPHAGAKEICTGYRVVLENASFSLLDVRLFTGRTHQIRAHLAHVGHPVLGDDAYGLREVNSDMHCRRQLLLAARLLLRVPEDESLLAYLDGVCFVCPFALDVRRVF